MFRSRSGMRQSILSIATQPYTNLMAKLQSPWITGAAAEIQRHNAGDTLNDCLHAVAKAP
jgi:hypothetical protein